MEGEKTHIEPLLKEILSFQKEFSQAKDNEQREKIINKH